MQEEWNEKLGGVIIEFLSSNSQKKKKQKSVRY